MNRKRNLLSALGLALVGTFLLVGYVQAAEGRAAAGQRLVPVLVAREDVARGASADELATAVEVVQVPASARADGAVTSVEELAGRVPASELFRGEQVIADRLGEPEDVGTDLPDGRVAVTVSLERQRALGGRVRPGTEVDVVATFDEPARTETVLRDVAVQAVDGADGDDQEPVLVTFGVATDQVEALVGAADRGRVWLAGKDNVAIDAEEER